ncbi:hypothetical protein [Streptomyces sp. NPDC047315]|uniref:hypothetical protein n=1 Tax=Streptomyces sp. NPDC047315 TaxID=3155142 RepID=UPI0033E85C19
MYTTARIDYAKNQVIFYAGTSSTPTQNASLVWSAPGLSTTFGRWQFAMWLDFTPAGAPRAEGSILYPDGGIHKLPPGTINAPVSGATLGDVGIRIGSVRAESFQVSARTGKPVTHQEITQTGTWVKSAALDPPDIPLRMIPVVNGTSWDAITQIAKASLSTAEFNADGLFRWKSRHRWEVEPTTPDLTVTSARELSSLTVREEIDACRNVCSAKWHDWKRVKADKSTVKRAWNVARIDSLRSYTIEWPISDDELDTAPPPTVSDITGPDGIRFTIEDTEGSATIHGMVDVSTERKDGKLLLTMYNRGYQTVWLRGRGGGPSVSMTTPSITSGATPAHCWATYYTGLSQEKYGVQSYDHDPDGWVQDHGSADALAKSLATVGAFPPPLLQDVQVLADPRIELGDVVRVVDTTGATLDTLAWVVGINISGANGEITQTLTLRGTRTNGLPMDAGLTPDPPVRPGVESA